MRLRYSAVLAPAAVLSLMPWLTAGASALASTRSEVPGTITTVAGGVGGPGKATRMSLFPCGLAAGNGSLYIGEPGAVRQVDPATDFLTTPAGTGSFAPRGDGGPATQAAVSGCGLAVDPHGNLLMPVSGFQVRVIAASTGTFYGQAMTAGDIYTVTGSNRGQDCCDSNVGSLAADAAGNVLIPDFGTGRVEMIAGSTGTFYGQAVTAGNVYTVAGGGAPHGLGDGGPASRARIREPRSVAVDPAGDLLITDARSRIRIVAAATGMFYGQAMTAGDIYTVAGNSRRGYSGAGGLGTSARINLPQGVTADRHDNILIADTGNNRVRVVAAHNGRFYGRVMTTGHIYTVAGSGKTRFAGDGGPATRAGIRMPTSVASDGAGNLVIANNNRVWVVAARSGRFYARKMTAGHIYTIAGGATADGDGGPATRAELPEPNAVAVTGSGGIVLSDPSADRVRMVAARSGRFFGHAMTAGDIYTVAGTGKTGFSGDGGLATRARLTVPFDATLDAHGNLVIVDTFNNRIRLVAARTGRFYRKAMTTGHIYTVAGNGQTGFSGNGGLATKASIDAPLGVAVDAAGNLVLTAGNRVKVVAVRTGPFYGLAMTAGRIYNVAGNGLAGFSGDGGRAIAAKLGSPSGIAMDGAGNLVVIASASRRIRVVAARTGTFYGQAMTAGDIYTVAGGGPDTGDGVPASSEELGALAVALDGNGNLLIADGAKIRVVAVTTGTFYGQAMIAGDIYSVAGTGTQGFSGDGGPATAADLGDPGGVAVDQAGDLVIADTENRRIRVVVAG